MPYDRLDVHERYCRGIWGNSRSAAVAMENIDRRLQRLEAEVDGRSADVGRAGTTIRKR